MLNMSDSNLVPVLIHGGAFDILGKHVDLGGSEVTSAHTLFKEHIQFGKGTAGRLRNPEIRVYQAEKTGSSLHECLG